MAPESGSERKHSLEHVNLVENRAAHLVGYSLFALVAYVLLNSGYGLFIAKRITDTNESVWGILIGLVAKIGMPILAAYKLKVAARLSSRSLRADAGRIDHVRLFIDCFDNRIGSDAIVGLVVARQCCCTGIDSVFD